MEEWHLSLDRDDGREAGQGGGPRREPEADGTPWWRRLESLVDVEAEPRPWRPGLDDGRRVGRRLAWLPKDWQVVPDIRPGLRGIRLDHLLIGPAGVFAVVARSVDMWIAMGAEDERHDRRAQRLLNRLLASAARTEDRLADATGRTVQVRPVLVLVESGLDRQAAQDDPPGVTLVVDRDVPGWFLDRPGDVLAPEDIRKLELAARDPDTWHRRGGFLS